MQGNLQPAVSVIVVNWNRRTLLQACLDSLLCQQGVSDLEIVVVDNGSTDGSAEMVESLAASAHWPVRLVRNQTNRGFCAANNQGFSVARSNIFALLNNDAEAEPGWLADLLRAFEAGPDVGMAASKILVWEDPSILDKVGHLIYPDGQNRGRGSGERDTGQYDDVEEVLWPDGCACAYRREMIEQIGGFDEDLFAYGDDAELGLRARIAGWRCVYRPRAVVRHHRGSTLGDQSPARLQLIERNRVLLAVKLFPGALLWKNPAYFLARLSAGAWAAATGRGEIGRYPSLRAKARAAWAVLEGDWQALKLLPDTWRKRRSLSRIRKLTPREVETLILAHRIPLRALSEQAIPARSGKGRS